MCWQCGALKNSRRRGEGGGALRRGRGEGRTPQARGTSGPQSRHEKSGPSETERENDAMEAAPSVKIDKERRSRTQGAGGRKSACREWCQKSTIDALGRFDRRARSENVAALAAECFWVRPDLRGRVPNLARTVLRRRICAAAGQSWRAMP
eukprot:gene19942-biopygen7024